MWTRSPNPSVAMLAFAAALAVASCGGEGSDAKIARARQEIAGMQFAAARVDLAAALADKGDDPAILTMLADVQLRLGDGDGAAATAARLERLRKSGPAIALIKAEAMVLKGNPAAALALLSGNDSAAALRIRAAALNAQGNGEGALQVLRQGAAQGGNARLLADYTRFLLEAQDLDGAERQIAALVRLQPDSLEGFLLSADVAARRGRYDQAQQTLAKAAERYPHVPDPWIARATTYDLQGQLDRAIAMTAKAAAIAPDDVRARDLKVQFAGMKGDWDQVRTLLARHEKQLDPISANGLAFAEAMLRTGHPEQARALFQRALTRSPNNPYARVMLAEAQLAVEDPSAALETVRPLADSVLAGPRELELAARAAEALNRPEAILYRSRLSSAGKDAVAALARQGQDALAREDWAGAIVAYRQLQQLGDDPDVAKRLALALSHAGQTDEAIRLADRARALRPDDPDALYLAGLVRARGGKDQPTALALLRQAAEAAPDNVIFRRSLATYAGAAGN